jgi:large subunit ribosomal protein L29
MKYTDIKNKDLKDLEKLLKEKKLLIFELRLKLKTMQLQNTSEINVAKKEIAQIKTAISAYSNKQEELTNE